jgi:hypothetical protein
MFPVLYALEVSVGWFQFIISGFITSWISQSNTRLYRPQPEESSWWQCTNFAFITYLVHKELMLQNT